MRVSYRTIANRPADIQSAMARYDDDFIDARGIDVKPRRRIVVTY